MNQAGMELRDRSPRSQSTVPRQQGTWGEGSSIVPMWDIPLASGGSFKRRGSDADSQTMGLGGLSKKVGSHSPRRDFAVTVSRCVLTIAGEGRNPSAKANTDIKQPQYPTGAEFPLLQSVPILYKTSSPSSARNAQGDDFNAQHKPAEVPA